AHFPHSYPLTMTRPPISPLFPYTTLFRSNLPARTTIIIGSFVLVESSRCLWVRRARGGSADGDALHERMDESESRRRTSGGQQRSEEHTSELQSRENLVCRLLLEKKNRHG